MSKITHDYMNSIAYELERDYTEKIPNEIRLYVKLNRKRDELLKLYERLNFINSHLYCNKQMTFDEREKLCKEATELSQQIEKLREGST